MRSNPALSEYRYYETGYIQKMGSADTAGYGGIVCASGGFILDGALRFETGDACTRGSDSVSP